MSEFRQDTPYLIFYDHEVESWIDDQGFCVAMTPECDPEELLKTFQNSQEFWKWYNR